MKVIVLMLLLLSTFSLGACGSGGSTDKSSSEGREELRTEPITDTPKAPHVELPTGPPPTKLVIKDLKEGFGRAIPAKGTAKISTNYISMSYTTRKPNETRWNPRGAFKIGFGPGFEIEGWEKGLVGMRVGGRRELQVPSDMAYDEGALLYVVDLLGVE